MFHISQNQIIYRKEMWLVQLGSGNHLDELGPIWFISYYPNLCQQLLWVEGRVCLAQGNSPKLPKTWRKIGYNEVLKNVTLCFIHIDGPFQGFLAWCTFGSSKAADTAASSPMPECDKTALFSSMSSPGAILFLRFRARLHLSLSREKQELTPFPVSIPWP